MLLKPGPRWTVAQVIVILVRTYMRLMVPAAPTLLTLWARCSCIPTGLFSPAENIHIYLTFD